MLGWIKAAIIFVILLIYLGFLWSLGSLLFGVWEALDLYLRTAP